MLDDNNDDDGMFKNRYRVMDLASEFLVARNVSHYSQLALRLGKDSVFKKYAKEKINRRKHLLLQPIKQEFRAVDEWVKFLIIASKTFRG
jgi:hypothetical protein